MGDDVDKALRITVLTSIVIVIVMLMLTFYVVLSPALSPIESIGDWDGDGVVNSEDEYPRNAAESKDSDSDGIGDNADALPHDENQTQDSDGDGIGDNGDFYDQGDGAIRLSLDEFQFIGYDTNYYRWRYYPNPWFQVKVDIQGDGTYDKTLSSEFFTYVRTLEDFFNFTLDIDDRVISVRFTIIAYDVWSTSSTNVTDYELMDYTPIDGLKSIEQTVFLPFSWQWETTGADDTDTPDCALKYSVEMVRYE